MKKILALLGVLSVGVVGTSTVTACGPNETKASLNADAAQVLNKVIAAQISNGDIKGFVNKDWTYDQFFNIGESNNKSDNFLQKYLYDGVTIRLQELKDDKGKAKYTEEQITHFIKDVLKWSQKATHLAYVDVAKDKEKQHLVKKISRDGNSDKSLRNIFLEAVKTNYDELKDSSLEDIEKNAEFWESHPRASLAIVFDNKVNNIDLGANEVFWTFTFATSEKALSDVIKDNTDLGKIAADSSEVIKATIKEKFTILKDVELTVTNKKSDKGHGTAHVKAAGYTGQITVSYSYGA